MDEIAFEEDDNSPEDKLHRQHVARLTIPEASLKTGFYALRVEIKAQGSAYMRGYSFEGIGITCRYNSFTQVTTEIHVH